MRKTLTALAALAVASAAQAAIVSTDQTINVPQTFDGVYINLLTGATGTSAAAVPGWDINPFSSGLGLRLFWISPNPGAGVSNSLGTAYLNLPVGSVVSAASDFSQVTPVSATAAFRPAGEHILGFRFFNESASAINYGYMFLTSSGGGTGFPVTITGWRYDDTGAAITVAARSGGVVPEPATWAMLIAGFGLVGMVARRRRETTVTA